MAVPMLVRFSNLRNLLRINNNVVGVSPNATQFLESLFRSCSTAQNTTNQTDETDRTEVLSKAMRAYLHRAQKYEEFMKHEVLEYETGKRHLANMMGMDPENFTQQDVNKSLRYLFPSGLYDRKARPMMKHPTETFLPQKEAEFAADGKPFHSFFYTRQPNYYETLHNIVERLQRLDVLEDKYIKLNGTYPVEHKVDPIESTWISKTELEKRLIEKITDENYEYIIKTLNKLLNHRMSKHENDFIMKYRKPLMSSDKQRTSLPLQYNDEGRPYVSVFPCQRKSSVARVTVWGKGTGEIIINGKDISYFHDIETRKQLEDDDDGTASQLCSIASIDDGNCKCQSKVFKPRERPSRRIAHESDVEICEQLI
ncbi:hypothetical protein KPH14_002829 [Odynerus spinipes]|uniref:28S ribosomal protein S9, mitochondrial n=1 Tax=Odynerus spinipes TaxID=1348599 RepID=A0AAD9RH95_9HYME|nr:hypothetical protein KPH14_002829 [Odynerus spinipes]